MTKNKKMMISALPFVALVVLLAVFCGIVSSKGYRLDMYIKIVFNEGIVLSIVATGAIFIYTLGSFDISLGAATLFAGNGCCILKISLECPLQSRKLFLDTGIQ